MEMDLHTAVLILGTVSALKHLGIDQPEELHAAEMFAVNFMLENGLLELHVCSHGTPKLRRTDKFLEVVGL